MAVSGTGVALATAGGVLLYAGLQGESPLVALRSIMSGHPDAVPASSKYAATADTSAALATAGGAAGQLGNLVNGIQTPGLPQLVGAVLQFRNDRYSQARRWQDGFSDCSSWVGKGLRALGITPPGASVTGSYLTWNLLVKVDPSQAQPGDLLVNAVHMAVVTGPGEAVGQQNPSRNVTAGTFAAIMSGTGPYLVLRYRGPGAAGPSPAPPTTSLRTTG